MVWGKRLFVLAIVAAWAMETRCDEAAETAKWRAQVEAATQSIAAAGNEEALVVAYYNRAAAYNRLRELDKAAVDADVAGEHLTQMPKGANEAQAWVQVWGLKGDIAVGRLRWKEAQTDYEAVQKRATYVAALGDSIGVYYYNFSRADAHTGSAYASHKHADEAAAAFKDKTGDEDKHMYGLSLRQRAIARYAEGDLEGAQADWAAAKVVLPTLGEDPFDPDQAPLNRAVENGREKERLARARFLMARARELSESQEGWDDDLDTGGTLSLADAVEPVATALTLSLDALDDLDKGINAIGPTWGLNDFDLTLERGRARAFVYTIDSEERHFSPRQVDEELNRAVKLRPYDAEARRARADWLIYRLQHLNDMAQKAGMKADRREQTRAALWETVNDDLGLTLWADPKDVAHHIARARLMVEQPAKAAEGIVGTAGANTTFYVDPNSLAYDIGVALTAPEPRLYDRQGGEDRKWLLAQKALLGGGVQVTGTALEWKEKAKVAVAVKDFDGALADLNQSLALDPHFADALNNRALVYRERRQWDMALRDLDDAIRIAPKHRAALYNRATLKEDVGDFDGSVADGRAAVEIAPDETLRVAAQKGLMNDLFARGEARSQKSETLMGAYEDYHESNGLAASLRLPPDARWLQYEGTMAAQVGRGEQALSALRAAHAAKPDDVWIAGWLVVVATALGEADAAAMEQEVTNKGDRTTLSNLTDVASSLKRNALRLTKDSQAETGRLEELHSRWNTAYRTKSGGAVIDGVEKG